MNDIGRVVIDTSSLISAALKVGSVPHLAVDFALAHCTLCASTTTLEELTIVLSRDKFDRYSPRATRQAFGSLIMQNVLLVSVSPQDESTLNPPCRDLNDNKFLALAQVAQATVLVTSDDDLLCLHPWCGVQILTPAAFVALIQTQRTTE